MTLGPKGPTKMGIVTDQKRVNLCTLSQGMLMMLMTR
jgi:hypothetical protein